MRTKEELRAELRAARSATSGLPATAQRAALHLGFGYEAAARAAERARAGYNRAPGGAPYAQDWPEREYSEAEISAVVDALAAVQPADPPAPAPPASGLSDSDSGAREACGGSAREPEGARGRFDLVPLELVRTVAVHLTRGAEKYAPNAWRSGMPFSRCISSALRHLLQFAAGQTDEDHLAACLCNLTFLAQYRADIAAGRLPAALDDRFKPPAPGAG